MTHVHHNQHSERHIPHACTGVWRGLSVEQFVTPRDAFALRVELQTLPELLETELLETESFSVKRGAISPT